MARESGPTGNAAALRGAEVRGTMLGSHVSCAGHCWTLWLDTVEKL